MHWFRVLEGNRWMRFAVRVLAVLGITAAIAQGLKALYALLSG